MSTATIVGGAQVQLSLDNVGTNYAQKALFAAGQGYAHGQVLTDLNTPPTGGTLNVYNVNTGGLDQLPAGGQALAVYGSADASLLGHIGQELLVGNAGNDTINAAGGNGTMIAGSGNNLIAMNGPGLPGGSQFIVTGAGSDTVNMWGGSATVSGENTVLVNLFANTNTIVDGTANALDVIVSGVGAQNLIEVNGASSVALNAAGNDTVMTGSHGGADIVFNHTGEVDALLLTHAGDRVVLESGNNIVHAPYSNIVVLGGTNQVSTTGGNTVTIAGGTNDFVVGGTGDLVIEHGGTDTVRFAHDGNDTLVSGAGTASSVLLLGGNNVANVVGGNNIISETGNNVINLTGGGNDTVIGMSTININDNANYTIIVHGNDTIDFGTGADTVIHGTATIHAGGGGVTVNGSGFHAAGHQATVIGGSASHAMTSMTHPTGATALAAGHGSAHLSFTSGTHGLQPADHAGAAHVTLVGYEPGAAVHGANSAISMDHGLTKITLGGVNHAQGSSFDHH